MVPASTSDPVPAPLPRPQQEDRDRSSRRRQRSAVILSAACWVSIVAAVMVFLGSGKPAQVTDVAGAITAAGIVTGLVGTDLLLLMLVLAARIPWVDRTFGPDVTMNLHRRLGKPAVYLILGHGALLTVGYSLRDGLSLWHQTLSIYSGGDMLLALLGSCLLVLVVVTSLVAVRRALAYEAWHAIHLVSYAAILVALPHQFSAGRVLAETSPQGVYWICLHIFAFGSIAWFRVAAPLFATDAHQLRVARVETLGPDVFSIHLSGRDLSRLHVRGGQYAIWRFWSRGTWWHAHPISFSAVPTDTGIRVTVRASGAGTRRLAGLRPGTRVSFAGPYGVFTAATRTAPRLAIVAGGIGITPVRALLEDRDLGPGETTVILRATDRSHAFLWDETRALVRAQGGTVIEMLGGRAAGAPSWMSAAAAHGQATIHSLLPDLHASDLFVCGPAAWTRLVVHDARAAGLPDGRIHVENFTG